MTAGNNVYNIGVRMTMQDGASPVLRAIAQQFLGLHYHISNATMALGKFRQALIGAGVAFVGYEGLKAVDHLIKAGAELNKIQTQMRAGNWNDKEVAEATARAWQLTGKYRSMGAADILEMQREMGFVVGDKGEVMKLAEVMTRMQVALQGTLGLEAGSQFNKQVMAAIRASELTGNSLTPEGLERFLGLMVKALIASGGTITPQDYLMATKYGRASALNWSDRFMGEIAPTLMQEIGASTMGQSFMSLYQAVIGGVMKSSAIAMWDRLGLLDKSKWNPDELNADGSPKHFKPGGFINSQMLMSDPDRYFEQIVLPAMVAKGWITSSGLGQVISGHLKDGEGKEARMAISQIAATLFGNRNAQSIADALMLQIKKMRRDSERVRGSMGMESADFFLDQQYALQLHAFSVQWHDLMQALGAPTVGTAVKALQAVNGVLAPLAQFAAAHPDISFGVVAGLGAMFGAMVVFGTAAMAFAVVGGGGIAAAALIGLAAGLGALAAVNWSAIKQKWQDLRTYLFGAKEWIDSSGGMHARVKGVFEDYLNLERQAVRGIRWLTERIFGPLRTGITSLLTLANTPIRDIANSLSAFADAIAKIGSVLGMIRSMGGLLHQQSFVAPPSSSGGHRTLRAALIVDGRVLGEAAATYIAKGGEHMGSSADFDGMQASVPVDYSYA